MSTQGLQQTDWGEVEISREEHFRLLDERARTIEREYKSTWLELADLCTTMRENELWREGKFSSFNSWLKDACPTSRGFAYTALALKEELKEIPPADLSKIPLGNAEVLSHTPKQQRNGKLLQAAKTQTPREFTATVEEQVPEAHVEQRTAHRFRFTTSQSNILRGALTMWRLLNDDPDAGAETALEGILVDFMQSHEEEYKQRSRKPRKGPSV